MTSKNHAGKLVNYLNHSGYMGYTISTSKYIPLFGDIGVCYGYPYLIPEEELNKRPWYNYHPAILSNKEKSYGDWGNYERALHDLQISQEKQLTWGVSLHVVDKGVDTGPVLRVLRFPLMSKPDDIQELGDINHYYLFQLFKQTIHALKEQPQTKEELDALC